MDLGFDISRNDCGHLKNAVVFEEAIPSRWLIAVGERDRALGRINNNSCWWNL